MSNFDWSSYIDLAQALDEQAGKETDPQKQEALFRAAISRAYYGAWCLARNRLKSEANIVIRCQRLHISPIKCLRDHGCVVNYYQTSVHAAWLQIGQTLQNMMDSRKWADYDDSPEVRLSDLCRERIWDAQDIRSQLKLL